MMVSDGDLRDLLARFYASAINDRLWAETLEFAAGLLSSGGSLFGVHEPSMRTLVMASHNFAPEFLAAYFPGEIYANDPRIPHIAAVAGGSFFSDHLLYDSEEMSRDPWVREAIDMLGFDDEIGLKLRLPNDNVATLAFLNNRRSGGHGDDAIRALCRTAPLIEQACTIGFFVEQEATTREALLQAMASKADGVILLGAAGQVTYMNDAAGRILTAGDGLAHAGGAFVTHRPPESRRLALLIADVLARDGPLNRVAGGQMLVTRNSRLRPYVVRVMPAPPVECFFLAQGVACIILVQDLARATVRADTLEQLFGLSPREAELAAVLVRLGELRSAAMAADMAFNTARNHLQNIFVKTGVGSQVALVGLLSRLGVIAAVFNPPAASA